MALSLDHVKNKKSKTRTLKSVPANPSKPFRDKNLSDENFSSPRVAQKPWTGGEINSVDFFQEDFYKSNDEDLQNPANKINKFLTEFTLGVESRLHEMQMNSYTLSKIGQSLKWVQSIKVFPRLRIPIPGPFHQREKI